MIQQTKLTAEDIAANMRKRGINGSIYDSPCIAWQKLALFTVIAESIIPVEKKNIEF